MLAICILFKEHGIKNEHTGVLLDIGICIYCTCCGNILLPEGSNLFILLMAIYLGLLLMRFFFPHYYNRLHCFSDTVFFSQVNIFIAKRRKVADRQAMLHEWDLSELHSTSCLGTQMFRYPIPADSIQPALRNHDNLPNSALYRAPSFVFLCRSWGHSASHLIRISETNLPRCLKVN